MTFNPHRDLKLNAQLRKELARPFGKIMKAEQLARKVDRKNIIYAVGDVTVATLLELDYRPKIAIFDYRTERRKANFPIIKKFYKNPLYVENQRGVLSRNLWNVVKKASKSKSPYGIRVHGEEDLASLACVYFARNGTLVMYGLRNRGGIAVIRANEKIRKYVLGVLKTM